MTKRQEQLLAIIERAKKRGDLKAAKQFTKELVSYDDREKLLKCQRKRKDSRPPSSCRNPKFGKWDTDHINN